jgi:hypothetical protein
MATSTSRSVNANVHVGAPLPGDVEPMPLPPTIVDRVPEYRDYDYVLVNDEIVSCSRRRGRWSRSSTLAVARR